MKKEDAENIARKSRNLQNPLKFFFGYIIERFRQYTARPHEGQEQIDIQHDTPAVDLLRHGGGNRRAHVFSHSRRNRQQRGSPRNDRDYAAAVFYRDV